MRIPVRLYSCSRSVTGRQIEFDTAANYMHRGSGASTSELWKARAGRGSDPGSLVTHTLETRSISPVVAAVSTDFGRVLLQSLFFRL